MAEVKISELVEHLIPADDDLLEISRDDGGGNYTSMHIKKSSLITTGDVVGPVVSVDGDLAAFSGVSGKIIRGSGFALADFTAHAADDEAHSLAKNNLVAVVDPTVNDDSSQGYSPNSVWIVNKVDVWTCADALVGAAVWTKGGGGAAYTHSPTTPPDPEDTPSWWDSEDGTAFQYYDNAGDPVYVREDPGTGDGGGAAPGPGDGDVVGPGAAVHDNIAAFNGTTGKLIKDGGAPVSSLATAADLNAHTGNASNPHGVNAAQAGADATGTAVSEVATHVGLPDPHNQYAFAADLGVHTGNVANPHAVNAAQTGAEPANTNIQLHISGDNPHPASVGSAQEVGVGTLINNFVTMTQAQYDVSAQDPTTVYVIVG